ncbi:MAG: UDP-glucose 4-epimerase GalE [Lentisphaeria bacterium]|nr:UDP-glucose 4-epimerase GalE [Lentisphaeria bacterium]
MNILVAGGAGYIGSCCTEYLIDRGHNVVVYDALITGHREAVDERAIDFIHADLADSEKLAHTLLEYEIEGIIHFAAFSLVGESMEKPGKYFDNNVGTGVKLLQTAFESGVRKIVFSSTAATYGMPENIPIQESERTRPINPYGESKLMFEKILEWYHKIHDLDYCALRYFNAAGACKQFGEDHNPETHLIPIVLQAAAGQRPNVKIFGTDYDTPDGTCIRDYIHVTDLAQAHLQALESDAVGSFNLGSGTGFSVREIIDVAREVTGREIPVEEADRRAGDPPRLISDSTAVKDVLGWTPLYDDVRKIVEDAWIWKRDHPDGYAKD